MFVLPLGGGKIGSRKCFASGKGDAGVDILPEKLAGRTWVVQCKFYAPKQEVGPSIVRESWRPSGGAGSGPARAAMTRPPTEAAYSRPPAPISASVIGLRSPASAARIIRRATTSVIGSLRSCRPSLFRAAENASAMAFRSSGANARLSPKYWRIGTTHPR
jgi:hypothetical protein